VFKKGKTDLMSNYRPISLLCVFHKLLEKIVNTRLYSFLSSNNILYEYQFGFRKFHSSGVALIDVVDNIFEHLDNCDSGVGICIDLQKAFHTVNHRILLKKLDRCGIRGIMFDSIQDYLSNRQQYVFLQNISSFPLAVTCGVPQGSVLGPLLFRSALHGHSHTADGGVIIEVSIRRGCQLAGGRFDASSRRHSRSSPDFR